MNSSTPIVVVAFNRPHCLSRILESLAAAQYDDFNDIPLIISIDKHSDNQSVLTIAHEFKWNFGKKIINYQKVNLGLRKHIIQCGDYALEYGSVIILEDDLYVSPCFYSFGKQALQFSRDKNYIGGISLYNHQVNTQTFRNFNPVEDGFDNWYFQFASSWGQAWTKEQWTGFKTWYEHNQTLSAHSSIPRNVTYWSNKSWLKFFIAYLIHTNKFFLYPKIGLSTNFSEPGTHNADTTTAFQVHLQDERQRTYLFSTLEKSKAVYDAFYENIKLANKLGFGSLEECCIDLNGFKPLPENKGHLLTTKQLPFQIVKTFGLRLKPIDYNIIYKIEGADIYLYNTAIAAKNTFSRTRYKLLEYNYKIITLKDAFYLFYQVTRQRLRNLYRKVF